MNEPFAQILDIIRARNVIFYPHDKTDAQLLTAADTLLKNSDNLIDHHAARERKARIAENAAARQAEALEGFDLYVQPNGTPSAGYVAMAVTGVVFTCVGYIIGAVTQ